MSTLRSGLPSLRRATLPMQTAVWMFRAQTMEMAGGASTQCIRTDLWETLSAKSDGLWESKQPHARTLLGAATCPVQNDVMNVYRHLEVSSPNNEDGRGSFDPIHQNRPWRDALRKIKRPVGKQTAGTFFLGGGAATCPVQQDVMKASSSMQRSLKRALQRQVEATESDLR